MTVRPRVSSTGLAATALTSLLILSAPRHARADEAFAPVTPYRPSVSSPAQLSAAGQLEAETGLLWQRSADQRRASLPYLLKFAWSDAWGVSMGGEARVWQRDASGRAEGVGDTVLTLKRAWTAAEPGTAWGLELGAKLPTARQPIGSGRADPGVNGIWSQDIGPLHVDTNLNTVRLGRIDDGTSRWQVGASTAVSTSVLSKRFGLTGELSATRRAGAPSSHQVLGAVTYSPGPLATFDFGVARAARPAPAVLSLFAGAVFPLARLP